MFFPHMVGAFICDQSANEVLKSLLIILENNKDLNFKIVSKNPNGLSCQLRTSHLLEHNSFLPHIDITIFDINGHTHGIINYSLQTSAKILLTIFCGLLLMFECALLCIFENLVMPFILIVPVGLILFAVAISILGLFFSSQKIHNVLLDSLEITFRQSIRMALKTGDSSLP